MEQQSITKMTKNMLLNISINDIVVYFTLAIIIGVIIYYTIYYTNYVSSKCGTLQKLYKDYAKIASFSSSDPNYKEYKLRDYYIKTAYNCCALGDFKNTYVDTCGLEAVLKQGVRCLDFEIYSLNNKPIVAVSSKEEYHIKETLNSVELNKVLDHINNYAFSGSKAPNPNDPLILHFRIKSKNEKMYDTMAEMIQTKLSSRLLGTKYNNEFNGKDLGDELLSDFQNKIIIIVDKENPLFEKTKMNEVTNIASNSMFMRALRNDSIVYAPDFNELIEFNKKHMTISMPNLTPSDENIPSSVHMKYGCQFIAMNYQNYDENLEFIETFFEDAGHAFVLKPEHLRFIPITIDKPEPQDPKLSYAPREYQKPYVKYTI